MNKVDFINKVIGIPWENRASSFDSVDCWGLVLLYYKHVLNIDLPNVEGYGEFECISKCWQKEELKSHWVKVDDEKDCDLVFTCYDSDGKPCHVGIYIGNGKLLHSDGHIRAGGSVRVNNLQSVERLYGKVTLHKYSGA